jgi:hypothetical protein
MVINASPSISAFRAASIRSQISWASATRMSPGATRWNAMKVIRPAWRVRTSSASIAPAAHAIASLDAQFLEFVSRDHHNPGRFRRKSCGLARNKNQAEASASRQENRNVTALRNARYIPRCLLTSCGFLSHEHRCAEIRSRRGFRLIRPATGTGGPESALTTCGDRHIFRDRTGL